MTRKEAEKYIKSKMCNNCGVYLGGGKCSDNCNVIEAIQALSQKPINKIVQKAYKDGKKDGYVQAKIEQQSCEDTVSREAILSKIKEVCFSKEWVQFRIDKGSNGQRDFLIDYIEQLPPVKQKPIKYDDAISRKEVLDQTYLWSKDELLKVTNPFDYLRKRINSLLPINLQKSQENKSKECINCKFYGMGCYIDSYCDEYESKLSSELER